ncbi:nephronectin-like isoform X2 [Engraulis encrasicolus]|uniref:nephronectin-like isoform X2 n=1 Tax=Engraulis encrasicolus TaxID=184585 RepID=UPI002FD60B27
MARNWLWETDWHLKWMLLCTCLFSTCAEFDGGWATQMATSNGLCRYGRRVDCCWGWTRHTWGHCQPVCQHGCKHGLCAGPNKCKCYPGYGGKSCNQDAHLCAMAECQHGCEVEKGEVRCQCPSPGLHLAPDGRTCVDIDECTAGLAVCPRFHRCLNTFGGYTCQCIEGYTKTFINGKYQCTVLPKVIIEPPRPGKNPTPNGNGGAIPAPGVPWVPVPNPPVIRPTRKPIRPTTAHPAAPPTPHWRNPNPHKPLLPTRKPPKPSQKPPVVATNPYLRPHRPPPRPPVITPKPPVVATNPYLRPHRPPPPPRPPVVTPKPPPSFTRPPYRPPQRPRVTTPAGPTLDNRISKDFSPKQRGDVHIPKNHGQGNGLGFDLDIELGNTDEEFGDDPEAGVLSCSFDHGLCGWINPREGDTQWTVMKHPAGESYLALPEVTGKQDSRRGAHLILALTAPPPPRHLDYLCLSFRHFLPGHRVAVLQVFEERTMQHSSVLWGRSGGSGWRQAHITLAANRLERIIIKGERRRDHHGLVALDDISLSRGRCVEERHMRR